MSNATGSNSHFDTDYRPKSGYLAHALRLGLATHPRFAGAIHQRLILDCLYEVPTQRLEVTEVIAKVAEKFDGITLTNGQARKALDDLLATEWVVKDRLPKTGSLQYGLTPKGQQDWSSARSEGFALEKRVREQFFEQVGGDSSQVDRRWAQLLSALDKLFRREAYDIASTLLDGANGNAPFDRNVEGSDAEGEFAKQDLAVFLRTASGDRLVFLRKLLISALAYYLFRSNSEADSAVRQHLANRTFYLDTTVLYSLLAEYGDLAALRRDLLRLTQELGCKLRITTETLREFQDSVAHYKWLLETTGITDINIARAVLSSDAINDLDDFRRGYYHAFLRDPSLTVDIYALAYETIEEQLTDWGIGAPIRLPDGTSRDARGDAIQVEHADEYYRALTEYLRQHPRRSKQDEVVADALARRDALHIAWVQRERERRGIAFPTKPSQVHCWFLTRDRHLFNWDREFVRDHGLGKIPRCLALEDWIESIAVFVPAIRDSDAAGLLALRELSLTCPPIDADDQPTADDLQEIGRTAQAFQLHPEEAARVAADKRLAAELNDARSSRARFEVIKSGVVRIKDDEIEKLRISRDTFKEAAGKARLNEQLLKLEREKARIANASLSEENRVLESDAEFGRIVRRQAPVAVAAGVSIIAITVLIVAFVPILWSNAWWPRRVFVCALGATFASSTVLWLLGFRRHSRRIITRLLALLTAVTVILEVWHIFDRPRTADTARSASQPAGSADKHVRQPLAPAKGGKSR